MYKRFIGFVDRGQAIWPLLPAVHTTNGYTFSKILDDEFISIRMCRVYNRELCYLFYGKPTYQLKRATALTTRILGDAAVCFVIKPSSITLFRLFAFDTGAFYGNKYDDFLPNGMTVDDFEMPATLPFMAKLVGTFFGSNSHYYDGDVLNSGSIPISKLDRVSEVFISLIATPASDSFDERCCSCEIQTNTSIPLNSDTLVTVVLPDRLADDTEVMDACARWGIKPILYHFRRATPESRTEVICEKLREFYEQRGYFA